MGKKDKNKKQKANIDSAAIATDDGRKVITDSRFAKVHTDPRFQKAPKRKAKVVIDSRFNRMFTDERFSSSSALLDKRGKHKKRPENALQRYYRLEEDAGEVDKREIEKEEEDEKEIKEGLRRDIDEDDKSEEELEKSKGDLSDLEFSDELELSEEEEDDAETDDATSTSDTAEEVDDVDLGEDAFVEAEQIPEIEKETHRLAVVNMDWNQVKAVDLFMLLSSCLPKGGQILHVAVYPSEFGLQRMSEEAVHGPVGLFGDERKNDIDDDDDEDEIDNEKLRAYEKSRLKYYFAVVECESVATADYLYKNCDGVELERSANKLDLRFIPDSMEFKHPPRDVAKDLPANYEPLDFQTRALQHSNILLSWDDDEPHRAKTLKRKLTADQLDKLELEEFLASTESDDNDEEGNDKEDPSEKKNKKRDMYRALIQGGDDSDNDEEEGQDMEVTFHTGLEDISKKILEKKDKKSETVWEAYLKKRKEKRKKRKNRSRNSSDDESEYSDQEPLDEADDFFMEDTPVERKKVGGGGKKDKETSKDLKRDTEAKASMAELELLFADDKGEDNNAKGYKIKPKTSKGKKKKGKEVQTEDKLPTVDMEDPRFSGLFSNPLFALDPTDPQFKRSATYARQFAQQQQKGREEPTGESKSRDNEAPLEPNVYQKNKEGGSRPDASSSKDKHELSSLVKSIKMKSKQIVSSDGNKKQEKMELNGEKRKKSASLGSSKKKARV